MIQFSRKHLTARGRLKNESDLNLDDFIIPLDILKKFDCIEYVNGDFSKILKERYN